MTIALAARCLSYSQNVGLGTSAPTAKLEVRGDNALSTGNAFMIKNSNGDTLLRMKNSGRMNLGYNGPLQGRPLNIGGIGANFFSNDATFGGAVFPTDTSLVIWSENAPNNYVILQPSWGRVGIGTYRPLAMLDVSGPVILGENGSTINGIIKVTVLRNIGSVAAGGSNIQTITVQNATLGSTVYVSPEQALPDGFVIAYARVSAANTVEVKFVNTTTASINPATMDFYITIIQ
jgi:hypothetical protein